VSVLGIDFRARSTAISLKTSRDSHTIVDISCVDGTNFAIVCFI